MIIPNRFLKMAMADTDEALAVEAAKGNTQALNTLISRHKDLLTIKSNAFANVPVPPPAVFAHSMKLLAISAKNYDPASGVKFRTFLESNLRGLNRFVHKHKNVLSFPQHKLMAITKFKEVSDMLASRYGHPPADWQLADALGWSIPDIQEMRRKLAQKEFAASGLENNVGKEQEADAVRSRFAETAELLYFGLTQEQKMVFDYSLGRHGKPKLKTDAQIAHVTGLSPSKINRIRKDIAIKLQTS